MHGLSLERVSHHFGTDFALHDIDLLAGPGEVVCVLGPSGCGKTTLLRLAAGLERLQTGRIRIGGRVVAEGGAHRQTPPEERDVGLMFQDYALFPHLTLRQNVAFGVTRDNPDRDRWVQIALREVGLEPRADHYPHTLSGGEQQRIALLRALAPGPRVLLLDEPFGGLDESLRQQLRRETLALLKRSEVATLIVTHDPEEAMFLADRIAVIKSGRIVQDAEPEEIYARPRDPYVARLFGPANEFRAEVRAGLAQTPLGAFPAPGCGEGTPVRVLVRESDIVLGDGGTSGGSALSARVQSARPLGSSIFLQLEIGTGESARELRIRASERPLPAPGTCLAVAVREGRAFVFPSRSAQPEATA
ncbi:MAG: ABC transporter ATP-binding protein [Proteobacteria bacterium]|nr:ABC transporter ATP-binding protein [Pseudomonadota bacterium]